MMIDLFMIDDDSWWSWMIIGWDVGPIFILMKIVWSDGKSNDWLID